jgi:hypothetical protein
MILEGRDTGAGFKVSRFQSFKDSRRFESGRGAAGVSLIHLKFVRKPLVTGLIPGGTPPPPLAIGIMGLARNSGSGIIVC